MLSAIVQRDGVHDESQVNAVLEWKKQQLGIFLTYEHVGGYWYANLYVHQSLYTTELVDKLKEKLSSKLKLLSGVKFFEDQLRTYTEDDYVVVSRRQGFLF